MLNFSQSQEKMYNENIFSINNNESIIRNSSPTASGKTRIITRIAKYIRNRGDIVIFITPFTVTTDNIKFDIDQYGTAIDLVTFCGSEISLDEYLVLNWQSFLTENNIHHDAFNKKLDKYIADNKKIFFIIDEAHLFCEALYKESNIDIESKTRNFLLKYLGKGASLIEFSASFFNIEPKYLTSDLNIKIKSIFRSYSDCVAEKFIKPNVNIYRMGGYSASISEALKQNIRIQDAYSKTVGLEDKNHTTLFVLPPGNKKTKIQLTKEIKARAIEFGIVDEKTCDEKIVEIHTDSQCKNYDMAKIKDPTSDIRIIITVKAGLVGLDRPTIGSGCILYNIKSDILKIQTLGRYLRLINRFFTNNTLIDEAHIYVCEDFIINNNINNNTNINKKDKLEYLNLSYNIIDNLDFEPIKYIYGEPQKYNETKNKEVTKGWLGKFKNVLDKKQKIYNIDNLEKISGRVYETNKFEQHDTVSYENETDEVKMWDELKIYFSDLGENILANMLNMLSEEYNLTKKQTTSLMWLHMIELKNVVKERLLSNGSREKYKDVEMEFKPIVEFKKETSFSFQTFLGDFSIYDNSKINCASDKEIAAIHWLCELLKKDTKNKYKIYPNNYINNFKVKYHLGDNDIRNNAPDLILYKLNEKNNIYYPYIIIELAYGNIDGGKIKNEKFGKNVKLKGCKHYIYDLPTIILTVNHSMQNLFGLISNEYTPISDKDKSNWKHIQNIYDLKMLAKDTNQQIQFKTK